MLALMKVPSHIQHVHRVDIAFTMAKYDGKIGKYVVDNDLVHVSMYQTKNGHGIVAIDYAHGVGNRKDSGTICQYDTTVEGADFEYEVKGKKENYLEPRGIAFTPDSQETLESCLIRLRGGEDEIKTLYKEIDSFLFNTI